jgi:hypothetical protein
MNGNGLTSGVSLPRVSRFPHTHVCETELASRVERPRRRALLGSHTPQVALGGRTAQVALARRSSGERPREWQGGSTLLVRPRPRPRKRPVQARWLAAASHTRDDECMGGSEGHFFFFVVELNGRKTESARNQIAIRA